MNAPAYPRGAVLGLLGTAAVSAPTRAAWAARLAEPVVATPRFFAAAAFATLRAVAARLVPAPDAVTLDLAGGLDQRLADGERPGWRYDMLPPDGEALVAGLEQLDGAARARDGTGFVQLEATRQDALLALVQRGELDRSLWTAPDPARWFEILLVELVEIAVANPAYADAMGVAAYADVPGWQAIGLGDRETREPEASER